MGGISLISRLQLNSTYVLTIKQNAKGLIGEQKNLGQTEGTSLVLKKDGDSSYFQLLRVY